MGYFQDLRCKIGSHTGDWDYDRPRECDQSRRCTNCGYVSTRARHRWGEWDWEDPDNLKSCDSVRRCGRCDDAEYETRHRLEWRYALDVMGDLSDVDGLGWQLMAAATRSLQENYGKCQQVMACRRCGYYDGSSRRTFHDWGDWRLSQYDDTSVHICARCGEREESE